MRNRASVVCLEGPNNLKGLGNNTDIAIVAANKQVIGTSANTAEVVTLGMSAPAELS